MFEIHIPPDNKSACALPAGVLPIHRQKPSFSSGILKSNRYLCKTPPGIMLVMGWGVGPSRNSSRGERPSAMFTPLEPLSSTPQISSRPASWERRNVDLVIQQSTGPCRPCRSTDRLDAHEPELIGCATMAEYNRPCPRTTLDGAPSRWCVPPVELPSASKRVRGRQQMDGPEIMRDARRLLRAPGGISVVGGPTKSLDRFEFPRIAPASTMAAWPIEPSPPRARPGASSTDLRCVYNRGGSWDRRQNRFAAPAEAEFRQARFLRSNQAGGDPHQNVFFQKMLGAGRPNRWS